MLVLNSLSGKSGSVSGFLAGSQGTQSSEEGTDLIQSPLKSMAALSQTMVNFRSDCRAINMKSHLKTKYENS